MIQYKSLIHTHVLERHYIHTPRAYQHLFFIQKMFFEGLKDLGMKGLETNHTEYEIYFTFQAYDPSEALRASMGVPAGASDCRRLAYIF